jgi:hypothetical protein
LLHALSSNIAASAPGASARRKRHPASSDVMLRATPETPGSAPAGIGTWAERGAHAAQSAKGSSQARIDAIISTLLMPRPRCDGNDARGFEKP